MPPRAVALARQRETASAARTPGQSPPQMAHHAMLVRRCIPAVLFGQVCLFVGACAVSVRGQKATAGVACSSCVPLRMYLVYLSSSQRRVGVRACNHRPQQHQHQATIPSEVASSPCIRALALACSSGQTPYLQWAGCLFLQISHTSSSTASAIPPCPEM